MKYRTPLISVLVPTLNSARVLTGCLSSIRNQDYPPGKVEIIIADGGSKDDTLNIAGKYKTQIFSNPLKTGEAGKAVALVRARGELVALIDSDNILPSRNWLQRMVEPFADPEILGSEPWEFTYRRRDSLVDRYCALTGVNDPYCYFVGSYDKRSVLSGKWTGLNMYQEDKHNYLKVRMEGKILPTIGANGTFWRKKTLLQAVGEKSYLYDTQIPYRLLGSGSFYFAKVKTGIIHLYCRQVKDFCRKQKRRAKDFFFQVSAGKREETYQRQTLKQCIFILATLTTLPLIVQSIKGYRKKADTAWFFHPLACWLTFGIYASETVISWFKKEEMNRREYKQ